MSKVNHIIITTGLILSSMLLPILQTKICAHTSKPFVVVIDAGHGGKDQGAHGRTKLHLLEKNINLKVALKAGELINKEKGVRVYYTRKTDVFVPLGDRSQYANRLNADLFISIHTNSAETREANGTEVYSFSPSSSNIAMRENAVMEMEDNYKKKYDGFDPRSSESYIKWDLVASDFGISGQSKSFASYLSSQLNALTDRNCRGIKTAGFWVLKYSKMPGVLVELGYISNAKEERYMHKTSSVNAYAQSIANAFKKYRAEYKKKTNNSTLVHKTASVQSNRSHVLTSGVHYRVQFYTGQRKSMWSKDFKRCVPAKEYPLRNSNYTYMFGDDTTLTSAKKTLTKVRKDFKDAYLVVFKEGKRLEPDDAHKYLH